MTVGVVIPCRNEAHWIAEVLDALAAQDRRPDDVVVVDDRSTDRTANVVEEWSRSPRVQGSEGPPQMRVRVVAGPERGVAAAVNAGIAALSTDVIVRLDGHCRPADDYVRRTVALATRPDVGVAGGAWTIKPSAATTEAEAIAIAVEHPFGSGGAAYRRASRVAPGSEGPGLHQEEKRSSGPSGPGTQSVDTVPFGCFRRALWEELGGLDERLWSNEDYDFNFRVRRRGLKVMLDRTIRCTYYARPTLATLSRQYGRYGWWKARMLVHHPASIRWRQLVPAMLIPGLLVCAMGLMLRDQLLWPVLLMAYPLIVVAGAVEAAATRRNWPAVVWIAAAFFTVQMMWSAGFWASLLGAATQRDD